MVAGNNRESADIPCEAWTRGGWKHPACLPTEALLRRYPAASLPSSYVIDKRGHVRAIHLGFLREKLEPELRALLGAPPPAPVAAETTAAAVLRLTGIDVLRCPACGERRLRLALRLPASPRGICAPAFDTS